MSDRKYALIKIEKGDYLLPGNDMRTLWRVRMDSAIFPGEVGDVARDCWALWRWRDRLDIPAALEECDPGEWDEWEFNEYADTRAEAIKRAMELEPR